MVTGNQMYDAIAAVSRQGLSQTFAVSELSRRFFSLGMLTKYLLMVLPAVLGVFVGAPLLAREMEQRTHLFAWAQSVSRMRWFLTKTVLIGAVTLVSAAGLAALASWWHQPLDQLVGSGKWFFFDVFGLVSVAYTLFAFAIGVAAGTMIGRTVPAMAVTLLLFTVTRTAVSLWRPRFMTPVVKEIGFDQTIPQDGLGIELYWVDSTRHRVPLDRINQIFQQTSPPQYLHDQGYRHLAVYQPSDRFWTFQVIEAAVFLGLAVLLIALSLWWLQRRAA
jgi:hypothetical protein